MEVGLSLVCGEVHPFLFFVHSRDTDGAVSSENTDSQTALRRLTHDHDDISQHTSSL